MDNILQVISAIASIISIPLAIYFSRKTNHATSEKARLDVIKTVSYKLSSTRSLNYEDIASVYQSKIREHQLSHTYFSINDIINDLKSDIMSNAFLSNNDRNELLIILSEIDTPIRYIKRSAVSLIFKRFFLSPAPSILLIISVSSLILANIDKMLFLISRCIENNTIDIINIIRESYYIESNLISRLVFAFFSISVILFLIHKYYKAYTHYTKE